MVVGCKHILLGDIGATNARFALLSNGVLGPIRNFSVVAFPEFGEVIRAFFDRDGRSVSVQEAVLAVAGPVNEGRCVLTNCAWIIDRRELSRAFGFAKMHLCNDFEAVALSLPHLTTADLFPLGDGEPVKRGPNGSTRARHWPRRRLLDAAIS
jgi:glucokinase